MKGAIFYSSKYGSTQQYADWIGDATGLPVFDVNDRSENLSDYDFLILGSPVIYFKLSIHKWVKKHLKSLMSMPIIFFTVSGAPAGTKLDAWIAKSLPEPLIAKMKHFALRGRQIPGDLTQFDRWMLQIAGRFNSDPEASKQELKGFDFMDKTTIQPIVKLAEQYQQQGG